MTIRSWLRPRINIMGDIFMVIIGCSFVFVVFFIPATVEYLVPWWNEEGITFRDAINRVIAP